MFLLKPIKQIISLVSTKLLNKTKGGILNEKIFFVSSLVRIFNFLLFR